MKPLDFVRTPKGSIAIIDEVVEPQNGHPRQASIEFLKGQKATGEKNAWWGEDEGLEVIDSLPNLLARKMAHPFSSNKERSVQHYFPIVDQNENP